MARQAIEEIEAALVPSSRHGKEEADGGDTIAVLGARIIEGAEAGARSVRRASPRPVNAADEPFSGWAASTTLPIMTGALNARQVRFVSEMSVDGNATQAAIRAGYSPNGAAVTGSRLLRNPKIALAIAAQQRDIAERNDLSVDWVISRLGEVAESDAVPAASRVRALELLGKYLGMFDGRAAEIPQPTLVVPEHWTVEDVRRLRDETAAWEAESNGRRPAPSAPAHLRVGRRH